ncbi:MAG: hypothetical protein V3S20_04385 [Dehalococcoidia bacterium]
MRTASKFVPRALVGAFCALSGHVGHNLNPKNKRRTHVSNAGGYCLSDAAYQMNINNAVKRGWI